MRNLLVISALMEIGAGLAVLCGPSMAARFLVGETIADQAALTVARVGGAGLLALGVACWLARNDSRSSAAKGLVAAMLLYNVAAVAILAHAGLGLGLHGVLLWPGVVVHTIMTFCCILCLAQSDGSGRAIRISTPSTANKE